MECRFLLPEEVADWTVFGGPYATEDECDAGACDLRWFCVDPSCTGICGFFWDMPTQTWIPFSYCQRLLYGGGSVIGIEVCATSCDNPPSTPGDHQGQAGEAPCVNTERPYECVLLPRGTEITGNVISGPYDTEVECALGCARSSSSSSSSPSASSSSPSATGVVIPCCPEQSMPRTLYLTITDCEYAGDPGSDPPPQCPPDMDLSVELEYTEDLITEDPFCNNGSTKGWTGTIDRVCCSWNEPSEFPCSLRVTLICYDSGDGTFAFTLCFHEDLMPGSGLLATDAIGLTCEPVEIDFPLVGFMYNWCCASGICSFKVTG